MVCSNHRPCGRRPTNIEPTGGSAHTLTRCELIERVTDASFPRPHKADDVHVTGTFDDWGKTEKLEKVGDVFEKEVTLPSADEKYYYKVRVPSRFGERSVGHTAC
jgi:hypothetical protein